MAFVTIPNLGDQPVYLEAKSVFRITHGVGDQAPYTSIEYGSSLVVTKMARGDVENLLNANGAKLVAFAASDTSDIYLSVPAITAVRPADPNYEFPGVQSIITLAGHEQRVRETVDDGQSKDGLKPTKKIKVDRCLSR